VLLRAVCFVRAILMLEILESILQAMEVAQSAKAQEAGLSILEHGVLSFWANPGFPA